MITKKIPKLNALILIGGKSKRMGTDKSVLNYHGKPQWQYAISLVEKYVDTVYVSVRKDQKVDYPNLIVDKETGLGPFGAILTALETHPNEAFLVFATDLPFIDKKTIDLLVSKRDSQRIATALKGKNKEYPEPLLCIWEPKALAILQENAKKEIYRPIWVLKNNDTCSIEVADQLVQNINNLEEYQKAQNLL